VQQQEHLLAAVDGDDRQGLLALAALSGLTDTDEGSFHALVGDTLRHGIAARLEAIGLPWAPSNEDVERLIEQLRNTEDPEPAGPARVDGAPGVTPGGPAAQPRGPSRLRSVATDSRLRISLLGAVGIAFVVVLIGGYAGRWAWTGFTTNEQLWDWMHLLLLPVALGTFPLWLRFAEHMSARRKRSLLGAIVAFALLVAAGYLAPLLWTGFRGNTLWDWLTLIVLPVTLTTVRAWPRSLHDIRRGQLIALGSLSTGWVITLIGGYAGHWSWTGYEGNTLWDWLQLLLAPIAINTILVPACIRWVSGNVAERAQEAADKRARAEAVWAVRHGVRTGTQVPPTRPTGGA
jgi:uncharacterized membrane protein